MGVRVTDSASNIVKWGLIAVALIIGLLFMFPWLVNLGVSNVATAWGDQITDFVNGIIPDLSPTAGTFPNAGTIGQGLTDFGTDILTGINSTLGGIVETLTGFWTWG